MGLAPILVERNFEIIKQVHESGVAILVVEQNANVSLSIADRGYVLSTGRLVLEGPAAELREHEDLRKAYLGSEETLAFLAGEALRGPEARFRPARAVLLPPAEAASRRLRSGMPPAKSPLRGSSLASRLRGLSVRAIPLSSSLETD